MEKIQRETFSIYKFCEGEIVHVVDEVAIEEPLEILIAYSSVTGYMQKNIAVTMRTPGAEAELAIGFLFTEGIISGLDSILHTRSLAGDVNRVMVTLHEGILPDLKRINRNFYTTSSCGICGKASIEAIHAPVKLFNLPEPAIETGVLCNLPSVLKEYQNTFLKTGGLHACALFKVTGELISLQEDVGRHNALDKLIGSLLGELHTLQQGVLLLSGRASFELVQKAAMAGVKIIASIGAPSSLAVSMALEHNITLIGFLRENSCNMYSGAHRVLTINEIS